MRGGSQRTLTPTLGRDPDSRPWFCPGLCSPVGLDHGHGRRAARRTSRRDRRDRERRERAEGTAEPAAIAVIGEPGIGKTRLLAELAARADESGCIVLSGSGSEFEQDLPFWVFVDALDEYVAGLDPRRLESLEDGVRGELAGSSPRCPSTPAASRARPRTSATAPTARCGELLQRLAATKPLVLVLDDVHWADSASIDLLGALLRRPPAASVLLALGARPRQMPERLAGALERAHRARALHGSSWARSDAPRPASCSASSADARSRGRALPAERGQPLLPRGARAIAGARARPPVTGTDLSAHGRRRCRERWPPR